MITRACLVLHQFFHSFKLSKSNICYAYCDACMVFDDAGNSYLSASVCLKHKTIRLKIHTRFAWLWSRQLSSIHAFVLCVAHAVQQNVFIFTQWCSKIREDFSHSSGGPQSLSLWPLSDLSLWCPLEAEKHDLCVGASLFVSCLSIPTRKVRAERFKGTSTVMGSTGGRFERRLNPWPLSEYLL